MARTITEVQNAIIASIQADSNLSGLNSGSVTAIWRLITRVVASAIVALEVLYDLFVADVSAVLAAQKPHTGRWYQAKSLAFQYGYSLVVGEDYYDNTGIDVDVISDSKIVALAAVEDVDGLLVVKVAKLLANEPAPLDVVEYDAFAEYLGQIKDAGVRTLVRSVNADKMVMVWDVYYDPLVLGPDGARLDGSDEAPVEDAIRAYLKNLPFDGLYVKAHHVDAIQAVEGVFVPEVRSCLVARHDSASFQAVDVSYRTFSGFLRFVNPVDLTINYVAHV